MVKKKINEESKEDRFIRIAEARTQRILNDLRLLGNCSNKSVYSYNDSQIFKIFNSIEKELRVVKDNFIKHKSRKFKL